MGQSNSNGDRAREGGVRAVCNRAKNKEETNAMTGMEKEKEYPEDWRASNADDEECDDQARGGGPRDLVE